MPCQKDGLPPARVRIESPYDPQARHVRRGHRRWTGYLAHVAETCDVNTVNVITDVAATAPTADSTALPDIHARLRRRRLLPAQHLVDGGCTSMALMHCAARRRRRVPVPHHVLRTRPRDVLRSTSPLNTFAHESGYDLPSPVCSSVAAVPLR
jgi:hypothetical protein